MAGRCNKVKQGVDTIVSEPRITLDARFFREDVIVLAFQVSDNFGETIDTSISNELHREGF